jgi:hypothetical protein
MKISLYLILFLVAGTICYSQQNIAFADGAFDRSSSFITIGLDDKVDVEGSKYIQDDFNMATISIYSGYKFNVKYNAYDDEMEVQGKDNKSFALNKNEKSAEVTFVNNNITYGLFDYANSDGQKVPGYFQKLTVGETVALLKKEKIMFIEEKVSKTGYDTYRPPKFKRLNDQFFIKLKESPVAIEFPKNKKNIASLFPNKKDKILKFIKENKIKTNKEEDLIKLTNYINGV